MGREEQTEEREVLDSIFPEEITDISETSYRISIVLDVIQHEDDKTELPILLLTINLPPSYPDEPPLLDVSAPPNAPKHPLLDIQSDKEALLNALTPIIDENLGMAMIFTLVSTLKDHAESLIAGRQADVQAVKDKEAAKAEEAENAKFHGQAVTRETFLAWRERFRMEMEDREEERRREEKEGEGRKKVGKLEDRMSGRELWEKGLVGKVEEEEEEEDGDGRDGLDEMERLKV